MKTGLARRRATQHVLRRTLSAAEYAALPRASRITSRLRSVARRAIHRREGEREQQAWNERLVRLSR